MVVKNLRHGKQKEKEKRVKQEWGEIDQNGDLEPFLKRNVKDKKKNDSALSRKIYMVMCLLIVLTLAPFAYIVGSIWFSASYGEAGTPSAVVDNFKREWPLYTHALDMLTVGQAKSSKAEKYYNTQYTKLRDAAKAFELHPYFTHMEGFSRDATWNDMLGSRITSFAKLLKKGQDSHRVEKDKCEMNKFFILNDFPYCPIKMLEYDDVSARKYLKEASSDEFPLFIKACHLTQGSASGTRFIKSKESIDEEFFKWMDEKWSYRPDDFNRVWREDGNSLTDELQRGWMIQEPLKQEGVEAAVNGRYSIGIYEFRVEVLYGLAYMAVQDGVHFFLRDGSIEDVGIGSFFGSTGEESMHQWMIDDGYLQCVWDLAERVAKVMHIDCVRIDIFLKLGDPEGCTLNEISLSSGIDYFGHQTYMAKFWAESHLDKLYKVMQTDKHVYELSEKDTKETKGMRK